MGREEGNYRVYILDFQSSWYILLEVGIIMGSLVAMGTRKTIPLYRNYHLDTQKTKNQLDADIPRRC